MRPTTKDLAKAAGVSLATIDRVLNGRPGVQAKTIQAVNEAIGQIGFVRNLSAANLARRRTYNFVFLLPRRSDQFLESLIARIEEARESLVEEATLVRYDCALDADPHQIARVLAELEPNRVDGVAILAPGSPQVRDAIYRLMDRGVQVVQFVSGQPVERPIDFVGIDNRAAGATAACLLGRFTRRARGHVMVIAETMNSRDSLERRLGFDRVLTRDFPDLEALPTLETRGDPDRACLVVRNAVAHNPEIAAAYILSSEAQAPLAALRAVFDLQSQVVLAHERTPCTQAGLIAGEIDAVIAQDPGHLVRSALRLLRARSDGREPIASQEQVRIEVLIRENLGSAWTQKVPASPGLP